jgi:hypothetical protein
MKFGAARFVSGLIAFFFIVWSVELFIYDIRTYGNFLSYPSVREDFMRYMARDVIVLGFGVFCLIRFRYWHKKAIQRGKEERNGGKEDHSAT